MCTLLACQRASDTPAAVDGKRIVAADREPGNWMSHGRTYDEQRFSPLKQIDTANVGKLKLAWYFDLAGPRADRKRRRWSSMA